MEMGVVAPTLCLFITSPCSSSFSASSSSSSSQYHHPLLLLHSSFLKSPTSKLRHHKPAPPLPPPKANPHHLPILSIALIPHLLSSPSPLLLPPPTLLLVDPWSPSIDSQSVASQLFALSLFPYLGFLYHITRSKTAPKLTLFGFYFLLVFVGATIPAGIYAKVHYGTSLSNVDWLHGGAESFLTLTNLFIVLGLRKALRDSNSRGESAEEESLQEGEKESFPISK